MPISVEFFPEEKLGVCVVSGALNQDELWSYLQEWLGDDRRGFNELIFADREVVDISYGEILEHAHRASKIHTLFRTTKTALVIGEQEANRLLAEFYSASRSIPAGPERREVRVFRLENEARDWLRSG